jgi:hypothetical protein
MVARLSEATIRLCFGVVFHIFYLWEVIMSNPSPYGHQTIGICKQRPGTDRIDVYLIRTRVYRGFLEGGIVVSLSSKLLVTRYIFNINYHT